MKYSELVSSQVVIFFFILFMSCSGTTASQYNNPVPTTSDDPQESAEILPAADQPELYLPILKGKRVGLIVNHTSRVGQQHLADFLLENGVGVKIIFAPEHGFRGDADAGEEIVNGVDKKTGLPVISLYGKNKQPQDEDLNKVDLLLFDIQDVGVRFYTYISTMHYAMQAAAEKGLPFVILDRPNPNGFYVDGPVLNLKYQSFVGMHPIPVVHGMTVGELAKMMLGENWLEVDEDLDLTVIPCKNYDHSKLYKLPIAPSPNLPNMTAIYLYPSLCFFEGTVVSVGRGTDWPFQIYGHPNLSIGSFVFTPQPNDGSKHPKLEGKQCFGANLSGVEAAYFSQSKSINLDYLIGTYQVLKSKVDPFFLETHFIDKLAGTDQLRRAILEGKTAEEIKMSWQEDLNSYQLIRKKYLLYPDFSD